MADLAGFRAPDPDGVLIVTCDADGALGRLDITRDHFAAMEPGELLAMLERAVGELRENAEVSGG